MKEAIKKEWRQILKMKSRIRHKKYEIGISLTTVTKYCVQV